MRLHPPIVPGMTQTADGTEEGKTLAMLATMRATKRPQFESLMKFLGKLYTPREPKPESQLQFSQSQQKFDQAGTVSPDQPRSSALGL